ncbi:hypothetical protein CQA54_03855 [Helicobacter equorum]|uniref:Uncharacterized protein n=1 Tax=Helicobacter equorum TaxID=361872 RepID=A0A3D8ITY2_9HELI|nr:hypothetical protein CQA54_03855 [Helicobacter equorum]
MKKRGRPRKYNLRYFCLKMQKRLLIYNKNKA